LAISPLPGIESTQYVAWQPFESFLVSRCLSTLWDDQRRDVRQKGKRTDPTELGKQLGRAISERRKALKLTQDDLAGLVEVDAETISRIERGSTLPSLQRLLTIADAIGAGTGELLTEASPLVSDRGRTVIAAMSELDERDQQLLLDFTLLLRTRAARR